MPDDNPDEWVTQDRDFARFGIDQKRWITNGEADEWKPAIALRDVEYPYHGMQVFDDPFTRTLELRCLRRNLPTADMNPAGRHCEHMERKRTAKHEAAADTSNPIIPMIKEPVIQTILEPVRSPIVKTHVSFVKLGQYMTDGWGYEDCPDIPKKLQASNDAQEAKYLLSAAVDMMNKMHAELVRTRKLVETHITEKRIPRDSESEHPVADGMLRSLTTVMCDRPIRALDTSGLSIRARKALYRGHFTMTSELTQDVLLEQRNCGQTTVNEILDWVAKSE